MEEHEEVEVLQIVAIVPHRPSVSRRLPRYLTSDDSQTHERMTRSAVRNIECARD